MPVEIADSADARSSAARVAILLGTKNGARFLPEQLKSFLEQTHTNWSLFVSDDGSADETKTLIERFSLTCSQKIVVRNGPQQGVCANFMHLATDPAIDADYFAFSDQDDIWYPDKLRRALNWLSTIKDDLPGLYCGRTELMSADGRSYGLSPLFSRPPSFQNALVQSLGGGNTMVFNRATKKLLENVGQVEVVLHDWWLYQLVSFAGGMVHYDPQPMLRYRQHRDSLIGSNQGFGARATRMRLMVGGRFRSWNATNIAALERVPDHLVNPENRAVLMYFSRAREGNFLERLMYLKRSGVFRQTQLGDIGLVVATIIKRI
jgi:glycosyltransferase involved in cell wall biosynthesis